MKKIILLGIMFLFLLITGSVDVFALGRNNNTAVPDMNQTGLIRWYRMNDTGGNLTNASKFVASLNATGGINEIQHAVPDAYTNSTGAFSFKTHTTSYLTSRDNVADLGFANDFTVYIWVQHDVDWATENPSEQWIVNCIEKSSAGRPLWGFHSETGSLAMQYNGGTENPAGKGAFTAGWQQWTLRKRGTNYSIKRNTNLIYNYNVTSADLGDCVLHLNAQLQSGLYGGSKNLNFSDLAIFNIATGDANDICYYNGTSCITFTAGDITPPGITYYNLSTPTGDCITWNTDKNNPCNSSDATPTIIVTTNESATCAIGISNLNYTNLGVSRQCSGGGTTSHTCTLTSQDELTYETSYVYIGCQDGSYNENSSSTSGALALNVTGIETTAKNAIESGIINALSGGYSIYTDQKIYARNSANNQSVGQFDKVAKKLNKIWAFNRIGAYDSFVNMFNITPVFYTLELANKTSTNITIQVELLINSTK